MQFRSKIFAVLTLVGVVPAAILGAMSFSVNRAEMERTVGSTQARVAETPPGVFTAEQLSELAQGHHREDLVAGR